MLDKFAAGSIIAKFSLSWRYFSVVDLVVSLNVEEKARAKVIRSKGCFFFGTFNPNLLQKNNSNTFYNNKKKKNKPENMSKTKQTVTFKMEKSKDDNCFICGE